MKKIAVIGAGLIGSSILRALKNKNKSLELVVIEKNLDHLRKSKELELASTFKENIDNDIEDCDVIFICTPLSSYEEIFLNLDKLELKNSIITDVGSAKTKVIKIAEKNLNQKVFVPGHPIAGTEKSGPQSGFKELFENRWFISTPCKLSNDISLEKINNIWKSFGSNIQIMDAKDHDSIMAITSHIPHLIAYNIVGTASELEEDLKSEVIKFSASGFRDFTRIAASDPTMWRDILLDNQEEILSLLSKFNQDLKELEGAIKNKDGKFLFEKFKKTKMIREKIIESGQD